METNRTGPIGSVLGFSHENGSIWVGIKGV
jgi:hypothetical protein